MCGGRERVMYYAQHPTVIETDDITAVTSCTFTPGTPDTVPTITLTLTLDPQKDYQPIALHLTNGVNHRLLPLMTVHEDGSATPFVYEPVHQPEPAFLDQAPPLSHEPVGSTLLHEQPLLMNDTSGFPLMSSSHDLAARPQEEMTTLTPPPTKPIGEAPKKPSLTSKKSGSGGDGTTTTGDA